jgi:E3 ubiquitin-protein ligase BRE1
MVERSVKQQPTHSRSSSTRSELYSERRERDVGAQQAKRHAQDGQARLDVVTRDLERANQKLRDAYREQDRLSGKLLDASRDIDRGSRAVRREARLEAALSKLEADMNRLRSERNTAEDKLRQVRIPAQTASELLAQMKGMESEMKMLKDAVASHKSVAEAATRMVTRATPDTADHAARMAYMQALVDEAVCKLNHWIEQYEEQVKANEELRWMIRWGVADLAGSEAAKDIEKFMKKELPALEKRLQAAHQERTAATAKYGADKLAKAQGELQGARGRLAALEDDRKRALAEAATLREESDMFWKEMDSVSEAYDASREQNSRLLEAMVKRDEDNTRLMSEAAAAARERAIANDEREKSDTKMCEAEKEVTEWKRRVEDVEGMLAEAAKERDTLRLESTLSREHEQGLAREVNALEISISTMKEEVADLQRQVEAVEAEKKKHLTDLKLEKTRADRANAILSGRKDLQHLATDDKEMAALRKMVNCSVCSTRLKDRMITRCNHLFCSECIQENLASRHRKCPGCGGKFSENDVQPFFFT